VDVESRRAPARRPTGGPSKCVKKPLKKTISTFSLCLPLAEIARASHTERRTAFYLRGHSLPQRGTRREVCEITCERSYQPNAFHDCFGRSLRRLRQKVVGSIDRSRGSVGNETTPKSWNRHDFDLLPERFSLARLLSQSKHRAQRNRAFFPFATIPLRRKFASEKQSKHHLSQSFEKRNNSKHNNKVSPN